MSGVRLRLGTLTHSLRMASFVDDPGMVEAATGATGGFDVHATSRICPSLRLAARSFFSGTTALLLPLRR